MKNKQTNHHVDNITAILLAAGRGTRMASPLPKVLHPVAGYPILYRILKSMRKVSFSDIRVVVGAHKTLLSPMVESFSATVVEQKEALGTADAVKSIDWQDVKKTCFIFNGDHPFLDATEIQNLLHQHIESGCELSVLSSVEKKPGDRGRLVYDKSQTLQAIVEIQEASPEVLKINEVNTGMYIVSTESLKRWIHQLKKRSNGEYYLTDIVSSAVKEGCSVGVLNASSSMAFGVNSPFDLSLASEKAYTKKVQEVMSRGVIVVDPKHTYIEDEVEVGSGSVIYPGVYLKGKTHIGPCSVLEPQAFVLSSYIGPSVQIRAGSYIEHSVIHEQSIIGPYAHLRPETEIGKQSKIGNFVEIKKSKLGEGVKASHLTYLGDATVGDHTNIGCGTVTCNFALDQKKYKTVIGKNVFIGSGVQIVAPVKLEDHSCVAAGSVVTKDVPEKALALGRSSQKNKLNYRTKFKSDGKNTGEADK